MHAARALFGLALGRRLPKTAGQLRLAGLDAPVTIGRDRWGIPSIEAANDAGAWFGLGFCLGQDRTFQLEMLLRLVRGTLSEVAGRATLDLDRLSRRIGFHAAAERQLPVLSPGAATIVRAYVQGINAGAAQGLRRRPHEFVLLRARPTPWQPVDVLGVLKLQSFVLASGWDIELARLRILAEDGPEALQALEPVYPDWLPTSKEPWRTAGPALDRLAADVAHLNTLTGLGAASNNWVLDGRRTASGRPTLANDPHLAPSLPPQWYLCRLQTSDWAAAGATFVGGPVLAAGHNGFCAWGLTAGLVDNTDLFIEEVGADGCSVREGACFRPCKARREAIQVRGGETVVEEVLETPRGPIVSPALWGEDRALSMRAVWLDPLPVDGLLGVHRARSFEEFRRHFSAWPGPSLSMVYADVKGQIGWQLTGQAPQRRKGHGSVPLPGWDPEAGWDDALLPFDDMPYQAGSQGGFLASANNRPGPVEDGAFLGEDWLDGYRLARIVEALAARRDWDIAATQALQLDVESLPWREMRAAVLGVQTTDSGALLGLELLKAWDGRVAAGDPAAAVFELFLVELTRRIAEAKAPHSADFAIARGFTALMPETTLSVRRTSHVSRLLREQPEGWFTDGWQHEIAAALSRTVATLTAARGPDPSAWAWGTVRPLTLRHPLATQRLLRPIFNIGPIPCGGDANTISQAGVDPLDPLSNPGAMAGLRLVIDVGDWDASRFVLVSGQSGNPLSPHYADQHPLWRRGEGVPIAWSEPARRAAVQRTLTLLPA